jgi:hypothetical protein
MFTLAHSITFTLAGLDILPLPPAKLTETVIDRHHRPDAPEEPEPAHEVEIEEPLEMV